MSAPPSCSFRAATSLGGDMGVSVIRTPVAL